MIINTSIEKHDTIAATKALNEAINKIEGIKFEKGWVYVVLRIILSISIIILPEDIISHMSYDFRRVVI